jgi:nitronate monooxygenase
VAKGGCAAEAEGKQCLCNGLLATIGLGQIRRERRVLPLVTWGEEMAFLDAVLPPEASAYDAGAVIDYLLSEAVG